MSLKPSLKILLFYALPALPLAALALPFYVIVPTFYTEQLGLSLSAVGATLLMIRLFDAASDPVIGWFSDKAHNKFGRRRGVFLISLPLTAFSAFMVFWPPSGIGPQYLAIWGILLSIGNTATLLSYTAWGAELSTSYRGRALISAYREGATLGGTLVAIALPFAIGIDRGEGFHGLAALSVFTLVFLPVAGMLTVWKVPEPEDRSIAKLKFLDSVRYLMQNKPFIRLLVAFVLNGLANAIPATLFFYFVSERLGAAPMRGPLLFAYFLCAVLGIPFALWLASRFGKHRTWSGAMLAACIVFLFAGFLGPGDIFAFAVICVLTGFLLGFDLVLPPAIQADVIDYDTARSGEQRSGIYFAVWGLATKLSLALAVGLAFPILAWAGFVADSSVAMPVFALDTLSALYAWCPVAPKLAAILIMWSFPIDEGAQQALREQINGSFRLTLGGRGVPPS